MLSDRPITDRRRTELTTQSEHHKVDVWPIWLHDIIGQAVGIVLVLVEKTKRGVHAATYQSASDDGSEDCIAIVEHGIWFITISVSARAREFSKKRFPVIGSGAALKIVGVSTFDLSAPHKHIVMPFTGKRFKRLSLVKDFGGHGLLPKLFFERERAVQLGSETLGLQGIVLQVHH